jgi:hypothetical protein
MKNKETKLIRETWNKIEYEFSTLDWSSYGKQLLELSITESKSHDRFRASSIERGISVLTEAKYFAIKRLYEYLEGETLDPIHYAMTQKSCYMAYSLAKNERFKNVWSKIGESSSAVENMKLIASWDYCDLIAIEDRRKGFKKSPVDSEVSA